MVKTAIILCGGLGKRLRPLTLEIPKPMVPINGKPMIKYHFDWLKKHGIEKVVLACGYKWEKIKEFFGDSYEGMKIAYSVENEPLGTGGAIKKALEFVDENEFFVVNGDDINNVNLSELRKKGSNTICLSSFKSNFGIVDVENGEVKSFREKPMLPYLTSMGVYLLNKNIPLPDKGDIEKETFPKVRLKAYKHDGMWITTNTVKDLEDAEKVLV